MFACFELIQTLFFFSYFVIILRLVFGAEFSTFKKKKYQDFYQQPIYFIKTGRYFFTFFSSLRRTKSKLLLFSKGLPHLYREENGLVPGDLYKLRAQPLHSVLNDLFHHVSHFLTSFFMFESKLIFCYSAKNDYQSYTIN